MSTAEIGRRVGCARTTVQARIRRLEVVEDLRYTLKTLQPAPETRTRAMALVFRIDKNKADLFKAGVRQIRQISRCEVMSGGLDMCLWFETRTEDSFSAVVAKLRSLPGPQEIRIGQVSRTTVHNEAWLTKTGDPTTTVGEAPVSTDHLV